MSQATEKTVQAILNSNCDETGRLAVGQAVWDGTNWVASGDSSALLDNLIISIRRLIDAQILNPTIDMASFRNRVTAVLETGTNSIGNIATVASVTNMAGVAGYQPQDMVLGPNLTAWALTCRARIT